MESLGAVVKELYTSFLLRDFAGKIVPGAVLLLAFASLFRPLDEVLKAASGRVTTTLLAMIAALSWTIMLGLQSVAEYIEIWQYYPSTNSAGILISEMTAQGLVQRFMRLACQADRQQYERFVVIKEATGNLFVSLILSLPLILLSALLFEEEGALRAEMVETPTKLVRCVVICSITLLVCVSLISMNHEHVTKQFRFAEKMLLEYQEKPCQETATAGKKTEN